MGSLLAVFALGALLPQAVTTDVTIISVIPQETDSRIGSEFNSPHEVYVDRNAIVDHVGTDRHQLLLFLPGTNGRGSGGREFCTLAAELGYHVIGLTYPTSVAATVCGRDSDRKAYEDFRLAIIEGGASAHISISRADSIENRLIKLLQLLEKKRPREDWAQFLTTDGQSINWEKIAVSGQSQGGGHAFLIGIKHAVARVIGTGAPKDYSPRFNAPAAWLGLEPKTPLDRFFAFNHEHDVQGADPRELKENFHALKLDKFGPPVDAATAQPPYSHTHILTTSYPAVKISKPGSPDAATAHTSVIANTNAARWKQAWTYLLTEPVGAVAR